LHSNLEGVVARLNVGDLDPAEAAGVRDPLSIDWAVSFSIYDSDESVCRAWFAVSGVHSLGDEVNTKIDVLCCFHCESEVLLSCVRVGNLMSADLPAWVLVIDAEAFHCGHVVLKRHVEDAIICIRPGDLLLEICSPCRVIVSPGTSVSLVCAVRVHDPNEAVKNISFGVLEFIGALD